MTHPPATNSPGNAPEAAAFPGAAPAAPRTRRRFLMLTHDQEIDRRIIQQSHLLVSHGWQGSIVCLSHDSADLRAREQGLEVARIGLAKVIPPCPVFRAYQHRQLSVLKWCYTRPHATINGRWPRLMRMVDLTFRSVSQVNSRLYRMHLLAYYHNRRLACPMPFDDCFYAAAREHPSDLIVAHDLPALPAAAKLAREWGVPLVYDAHELYYEQAAFSRRQRGMMRRIEAELLPQCRAAFTVNESIAREMGRRYGCPPPGVLLNALDPRPDFDPSRPPSLLRQKLTLAAEQRILLFQGGLLANRNLDALVRAMAHVRSADCVLVFLGNGPLRGQLEASAARAGILPRVRFVPAVAPAELLEWTASADVGIIPYPPVDLNTRLCTPNKLFEYIQAGLPILANDLPELRRFVRDTGFGHTAAMHRPKAIALAIDQLMADRNTLASARQRLLQKRHEYSWSHASREYARILNALVPETEFPAPAEVGSHAAMEP